MKLSLLSVFILLIALGTGCATPAGSIKPATPGAPASASSPLRKKEPAPLTKEEAASRSKHLANIGYILWFGLDSEHNDYQGRATITFELREKVKDSSSEVFLDFVDGALLSLSINGQAIAAEQITHLYDQDRIHLKLSDLKPGSNRVEIAYSHGFSTTGEGLHRFKDPADGKVYLYTDFEPYNARRAFPCFDQPDLKASYELTVEAPEEWSVVANTLERERTKVDGRSSWAFPPTPKLSTYLFAIAAGPYKSWKSDAEGIPIRLFARDSMAKYVDADEWLAITKQGLAFYQEQFAYSYPFSKYDQIIVPDFNEGAMENAGAVTFSEKFIYRTKVPDDKKRGRADVILHEMAHMWFGDLVTMRWWNGLWLNESFATFMATIAVDSATQWKARGESSAAWQGFFSHDKQWAYWEDDLVTTHPIEVSVPNTAQAFANFDGVTYGKGAAALKQLRFYLGEDDFREGVRRYFQRFAFRNTTLADFMNSLAEASSRKLGEWQRVWLQTPGMNAVEAVWSCKKDEESGKDLIAEFKLKQGPSEFSPYLRPHKTIVALYRTSSSGNSLSLKETFETEYNLAETPLEEAIGKPCPNFVFPNHKDYDYAKVVLDPKSLEIAKTSLSGFTDPFVRQMLWHTLSKMVIDGKLSATEYIDTVLTHLGKERNTEVITRVVDSITHERLGRNTALKYLTPDLRKSYLAKLESFMNDRVKHTPGGSDLELVWFLGFLKVAHSPEQLEFIRAVLAGKKGVHGIKIDQERRWELLRPLARAGLPEVPQLIEAELKKDPTDSGKKHAIELEVVMPDLAIKEKWFKRITKSAPEEEMKDLTPPYLSAAMDSFFAFGQESLAESFAARFSEALPKVAGFGDEHYVEDYAVNLFPATCDAKATDLAGSLQSSSLPASVQKALKIFRQEESRCVRGRQLLSSSKTGQ